MLAESIPAQGEVFNVAVGERISLNDLISILKKLTGSAAQPIYRSDRIGDVRDSLADIQKANRELGYIPGVMMEEGLRKTISWFHQKEAHSIK